MYPVYPWTKKKNIVCLTTTERHGYIFFLKYAKKEDKIRSRKSKHWTGTTITEINICSLTQKFCCNFDQRRVTKFLHDFIIIVISSLSGTKLTNQKQSIIDFPKWFTWTDTKHVHLGLTKKQNNPGWTIKLIVTFWQ